MTQTAFHYARPVHEQLPANAQAYVRRLEELSGARISVIGVGPGRDQNVVLRDVLDGAHAALPSLHLPP